MKTKPTVSPQTKRRKSPARWATLLEELATLLSQADEAVIASDADDRVTAWNAAAEALYGWQASEVLGRTSREVLQTEFAEADLAMTEHYFGEATQVRKDGTRFPVEVSARTWRDQQGRAIGSISINRNITARKPADEKLRASEERYRVLFEQSPDGVVILDPATTRPLEFNDQVCRQLGYTRQEFSCLQLSDIEAVESLEDSRTHIQNIIRTGRDDFETRHRTKQGEIRDVYVIAQVLRVGEESLYCCIWRDITERKRAEEQLRENEERNRAVLNALPDMIFVFNRQEEFVDFSAPADGALLMPPERFVGKSASDVLPPDIAALTHHHLRQVFETGQIQVYQYPLAIDGSPRFFESRLVLKGRDAALAIVSDITERKRAEEKLAASETKLRAVFAAMHDVVLIIDWDGVYREIAPTDPRLLYKPPEELLGKSLEDVFPLPEAQHFLAVVREVLATQQLKQIEYQLQIGETSYWFSAAITPMSDRLSVWVARDITERKQAEEARLESEERFRLTFQTSPDAINVNRLSDGLFLDINDGFTQLTGFTRADVIGKTSLEINIWQNPADRQELVRGLLEKGYYENLEAQFRRKDGSLTTALMSARVTRIQGLPAIISITRDIAERKRTEEALRESEERYRLLFEQANDAILISDEMDAIIDANQRACDLLGYTRAELLSLHIPDIQAAGRRGPIGHTIRAELAQYGEAPFESSDLRRDGTIVPVEVTLTRIVVKGRKLILNFVRDITERKRREREVSAIAAVAMALRTSSTRDEMLPIIVDQVFDLLNAETVLWASRDPVSGEAVVTFGRDLHENLIGRRFPPGAGVLGYVLLNGQPYVTNDLAHDPYLLPLDQAERLHAVMCAPLLAENRILGALWVGTQTPIGEGEVRLLVAIADIAANALHRAEVLETLEQRVADRTRELAEANERLKDLDRLKSKFVSDVSHELRAPMTALSLNVDLLEHGRPDKRPHYLRLIREQVQRENQLIEDILNLSRLELGAAKARLAPVDVNALIAQIVALHQPVAEARNLAFTATLEPGLPAVQGEENQLAQVITNLIGNALNYTATGGVNVRTLTLPGEVLLEVNDTGLGIAPDDLPHLFERFYRGNRTQQIRGSGLGLAIVKEIVDLHDGRVEVESPGVPGLGATFRVYFPALARE